MAFTVSPEEFEKRRLAQQQQINLPTADARNMNQPVPLAPTSVLTTPPQPVQQQTPQIQQQGEQLLTQAQQKAAQPMTQQLPRAIETQALNVLQQPQQMQQNFEQIRKAQLGQLDAQRANSLESLRQQTGQIGGAGTRQAQLMQQALGGAEARNMAEAQLLQQEQTMMQDAGIKALQAGTQSTQALSQMNAQDINNMINAAGSSVAFAELAQKQNMQLNEQQFDAWKVQANAELQQALQTNDIEATTNNLMKQLEFEAQQAQTGRTFTAEQEGLNRLLQTNLKNMDIDAQKNMINLKSMIDKDMMISQQDWQSTEAELDRLEREALQKNDFGAQMELEQARNEFQALRDTNQQKWATSERIADNAFNMKIQVSEQDFNRGMQIYQNRINENAATKEFGYQKTLQQDMFNFEFHKQTQNLSHEQTMIKLQSELQETKAQHDTIREQNLMRLQDSININQIKISQGHDQAMAYLNKKLQGDLANENFEQAKSLQQEKYKEESNLQKANLAFEQAKLQLQQQGIDIEKEHQQFIQIQQAVNSGALSPKSMADYMKKTFAGKNIDVTLPDPNTATYAMVKEFELMKVQYHLAHGGKAEDLYDKTGAFIDLPGEKLMGFSSWMQKEYYGKSVTDRQTMIDEIQNKTGKKVIGVNQVAVPKTNFTDKLNFPPTVNK